MKPMLAFKFADNQDRLEYPCFVQPKLNGVRMLFQGGFCQSRDAILWHPSMFIQIREPLEQLDARYVLDGELYVHGWSLQQINAAASVNRKSPSARTNQLEYHVFDCVDLSNPMLSFAERNLLRRELLALMPPQVKYVVTHEVNREKAEGLYAEWRHAGYEGMMYRLSDSPYGHESLCGNKENRWKSLLKRKEWMDEEFLIRDFRLTTGEKGEQGFQLICATKEGKEFSVGSGLSDGEVLYYSSLSPVGRQAKVRYEMLSDTLIPLKPTIEAIL